LLTLLTKRIYTVHSAESGDHAKPQIRPWRLPQICHKPKRAKKDNGGFLRATEG